MNTCPAAPKLVNFCQVPLTKHVECGSVYADDHQPENLVTGATISSHKPQSFRVEHFVRPPVNLDFSFLAPVDVACVVVKPDLSGEDSAATLTVSAAASYLHRQQQQQEQQQELVQMGRGSVRGEGAILVMKNRVFERRHGCRVDLNSFPSVLGSRVTRGDTTVREVTEVTLKELLNVKCLRLTVSYFSGPRPVSLKLVEVWGKLGVSVSVEDSQKALSALAKLEKESPAVTTPRVTVYKAGSRPCPEECLPGCQFCEKSVYHYSSPPNGKLQEGRKCSVKTAAFSWKEDKEMTHSYSPNFPVCQSVQRVVCGNSPAPGQSFQSVWSVSKQGESGNQCSTQQSCQELDFSGYSLAGCERSEKSIGETSGGGVCDGVPERFLDEITCEIMVLPMLLPSGHFVDRSTLDKLHTTDCMYGRPPSDPFTGVSFTENVQPQFSVELKQQIDSFTSRHRSKVSLDKSTESSPLGKTLGSATEIALHLSSTKSGGIVGKKRGRHVGTVSLLLQPPLAKRSAIDPATVGRDSGRDLKERDKWISSEVTTPQFSSSSVGEGPTVAPGHQEMVEGGTVKRTMQSHELELASSLDRELQDLLHN